MCDAEEIMAEYQRRQRPDMLGAGELVAALAMEAAYLPDCRIRSLAEEAARRVLINAQAEARAQELEEAIREAIPGLEEAEDKLLMGDEGCLWPVEILRTAISNA